MTGETLFDALRACRLWHAASDEGVRRLAEKARAKSVAPGAVVAEEGEPAKRFGVLVSGHARVFRLSAAGRKTTFEDVCPGEPLGAVAALAGGRYPAHIEATEPSTIAWLPRRGLFDLMAEEPAVAESIVTSLASRVVHFTSFVASLTQDVPARLAGYLFQRGLSSGRASGSGLEVDLGMSKAELASALGTVPETLSRALGKLKTDGLVEVHGRKVVLRDVGALARLSSGYDEG